MPNIDSFFKKYKKIPKHPSEILLVVVYDRDRVTVNNGSQRPKPL